MSSVRVVFAEMDGSDEMVRSVISQLAAQVSRPAPPLLAGISDIRPLKALAAPLAPRRLSVRRKPARKIAAPASEAATPASRRAADAPDALTGRILACLSKCGMSSGDLIAGLGAKRADIYYRLSSLRKSGKVETRMDEADAVRKNYLK